jgi:hypothetical protein
MRLAWSLTLTDLKLLDKWRRATCSIAFSG